MTTLARVPLAQLDAWCRSQQGATTESRGASLTEADALRAASVAGDDSWRCLSAYRALVDLALAGPQATVRASWMVAEDPGRDATTRRFAEAAADEPGDVGVRAQVLLAECDTRAGLVRAAERRLRALWPRVRGTATSAEVWTCSALAELFTVERREFEALVIARRASEAAEAATGLEPVDVAHARSAYARALFALGDTPRLLAHLPKCIAAAHALDATDAGRARFHVHLLVARSALGGGEFELARRHIALADEEHARDPGWVGHAGHALASTRARLAREEGDADGLRAALLGIPESPSGDPARAAARAALEASACALEGRVEAASRAARECLAILEAAPGSSALSASVRLHEAESIARASTGHGLPREIVDGALRVAAAAAFERLIEIEGAARDLPSFGAPAEEDLRALAEYRARFVRRHVVVLARLRERVEAAVLEGTLSSWAAAGAAGLTTVCAWCLSVRDVDGAWLPLGHLLPSTPALPVTHGICARCRLLASEADRAPAPGPPRHS